MNVTIKDDFTGTFDASAQNTGTKGLIVDATANNNGLVIKGTDDADSIVAGDGTDTLNGEVGEDTLTGGSGADVFQMVTAEGADTITDFSVTEDDFDWNTALKSIDASKTAPTFQSAAAGTAIANTTTVFELTGVTTGGTAANLVTALAGTATNANIAAGDKFLFVNYIFTTAAGAQIWEFVATGANVTAGELTLQATLQNVAADSIVTGNFI